MYLRLGNIMIADSDTDGVTRTLSAPAPELSLSPESIGVIGARCTRQISRSGATYSLDITIGRRFANLCESEKFSHRHMRQLNGMTAGILQFKTMTGDIFAYANAVLNGVSVENETGQWIELKYSFTAGGAFDSFGIRVGGAVLQVLENILTVKV